MARAPLSLPASMLIFKNITFHGFWMSRWADVHSKQERYAMFEDLFQLMQRDQLGEPRWTPVEFNEAAMKHAVDAGISGYAAGKQIVQF